jgi:hypothetical protein
LGGDKADFKTTTALDFDVHFDRLQNAGAVGCGYGLIAQEQTARPV